MALSGVSAGPAVHGASSHCAHQPGFQPGALERAADDRMDSAARHRRGRDFRLVCITPWRSEEHTSELQSLMRISYAVFCLKKKKKHTYNKMITVAQTTMQANTRRQKHTQ